MAADPKPSVDFSALKRRGRLPPPPEEASENLAEPEHAPAPVGTLSASPHPSQDKTSNLVLKRERKIVKPYVEPIPPPPSDGRHRLRTGRVEAFSTRVRPEFRPLLIRIADNQQCTMAEALEMAVDRLAKDLGLL
jgi:hypothetical protein